MTPTPVPICPKCGYDQSGAIATWDTQCPIDGTCPECGLGFAWADVFDPSRQRISWFAEHALSKRSMLFRTIPTLWMLLVPYRFWKRVRIEKAVYPRKGWVWCLILLLLFYLSSVLGTLIVVVHQTYKWNELGAGSTDQSDPSYWISSIFAAMKLFENTNGLVQNGMQFVLLGLGMVTAWSLILCGVPITRRIAKVRLAHVSRAMSHSLVVIMSVFMLTLLTDCISDVLSTAGLTLSQTRVGNRVVASSITQMRFRQVEYFGNIAVTAYFVFLVVWIQWFWVAAIVQGWRIRSILLPILGFIASVLGGFTVFMYILVY